MIQLAEASSDYRREFVADTVRTQLALQIRSLRRDRGWTQAELGRCVGKPQSVISRIENPDYGPRTLEVLLDVAAGFDLPVAIDIPSWEAWHKHHA